MSLICSKRTTSFGLRIETAEWKKRQDTEIQLNAEHHSCIKSMNTHSHQNSLTSFCKTLKKKIKPINSTQYILLKVLKTLANVEKE